MVLLLQARRTDQLDAGLRRLSLGHARDREPERAHLLREIAIELRHEFDLAALRLLQRAAADRHVLDEEGERPPQQRAVFLLRDIEQQELAAICNILEVTESYVRVLLHRARLKLMQVIDRYQETGEC